MTTEILFDDRAPSMCTASIRAQFVHLSAHRIHLFVVASREDSARINRISRFALDADR
jgi:hypothetical protein